MVNKILVNEDVLDNLLVKALPQEYEVLLSDYPLSDDEESYFNLINILLKCTVDEVIKWLLGNGRSIVEGYDELSLDFWEEIEGNINEVFKEQFVNISLLLLSFYQKSNNIAYSSLNLSPIFSQQDWSAFGIIKQHNYNVINDLIKDLNKNLRNTLWEGIKNNLNVQEIADNLIKAGLKPAGKFTAKTRAEMIAATERSRIVNTAKLQCYVDNGITEFDIITAGDSRVCSICLSNEANNPYTIEEIILLIPSHPRCRCGVRPSIINNQLITYENLIPYVVDLTASIY